MKFFCIALLMVNLSSCKSVPPKNEVSADPVSGVVVSAPEPVKPPIPKLEWKEDRIAPIASKLKQNELVEIQVLLKSAFAGDDFCSFSPEWLTTAPQYFRGEWDTYFSSKGLLARQMVCGQRLNRLEGPALKACAEKAKVLCEQF